MACEGKGEIRSREELPDVLCASFFFFFGVRVLRRTHPEPATQKSKLL